MADAYDMIYVAQCELQELVGEDSSRVSKAKETVVCKDGPQSHSSSMQNCLMAQAAQTCMAMYDLDAFANNNIPEHREEGEDGGEGSLAVDDEEGHVVDLQTIGEVSDARSACIRVCDDYDLMAAIDEFLGVINTAQSYATGFLQWTAGTCDSLHLLRSMRRQFASSRSGSYRAEGRSCR